VLIMGADKTAMPQTFEITNDQRTLVVVCNPELQGRSKWFYYDKDESGLCTDPASKQQTLTWARAALAKAGGC
jgi:hypothetical protein